MTGVMIGPAMSPDEERAHKAALALVYADEAERAVELIEAKAAGIQETLAAARAEADKARALARELNEG